jgi:hypothetical protein
MSLAMVRISVTFMSLFLPVIDDADETVKPIVGIYRLQLNAQIKNHNAVKSQEAVCCNRHCIARRPAV